MRTIRTKLLLLLVVSALTPLIIFGVLSLFNFQRSLRSSIQESYQEITNRASEEIGLFLGNSREILKTLALDLVDTNLTREQQTRIIENYVIRFPQFLKILTYSPQGKLFYSTSLKKNDEDVPAEALILRSAGGEFGSSPEYLSEDLTPVLWFLIPMESGSAVHGVLAAQIDLMQMWKWVSETRLGEQGYVSVVDKQGALVASGNPLYKKKILSSEDPVFMDYLDLQGNLGQPAIVQTPQGAALVSVQMISEALQWYLVLAQPTREAFAAVRTTTYFLLVLIFVFLGLGIIHGIPGLL